MKQIIVATPWDSGRLMDVSQDSRWSSFRLGLYMYVSPLKPRTTACFTAP